MEPLRRCPRPAMRSAIAGSVIPEGHFIAECGGTADNAGMSLRCFVEQLSEVAAAPGRTLALSEQESRHARLARRLVPGDPLVVFDGKGREAPASVVAVARAIVEVDVGQVAYRERPLPALTLAVAMPKGPRQDVLIEKCTELGVAAIQPLITARSVSGASDHKRDKWRRATIEAAKQSGQCWLPELAAPLPLDQCLADAAAFDLRVAAMLGRNGSRRFGDLLGTGTPHRIIAFVGPEGGWTPTEEEALISAGVTPVCLGPNTLRIETAAICLAAAVHVCQPLS